MTEYLGPKGAAAILGITPTRIRELDQALRPIRLDGRNRAYDKSVVLAYAAERAARRAAKKAAK